MRNIVKENLEYAGEKTRGRVCPIIFACILICSFLFQTNSRAADDTVPLPNYFLYGGNSMIACVKDGKISKFSAPDDAFMLFSLFRYGSDKCLIETDNGEYYIADSDGVNLFIDDMQGKYNTASRVSINRYGIFYQKDENLWTFKRFDGRTVNFENVYSASLNAVSPNGRQFVTVTSEENDRYCLNTALRISDSTKFEIDEAEGIPVCAFNNGSFIYYAWNEDEEAAIYYIGRSGKKELYKTDRDVLTDGVYSQIYNPFAGDRYNVNIYFNKSGSRALICHDYIIYTADQNGGFNAVCELDPENERFIDFFGESLPGYNPGSGIRLSSYQTSAEDFNDIYFTVRDYSDTGEIPQIYMSTYELYRANDGKNRLIFKCDTVRRICGNNILYSDGGEFYSAKLSGDESVIDWRLNADIEDIYLTPDGNNGYVYSRNALCYADGGKLRQVLKSPDLILPAYINSGGAALCITNYSDGLYFFNDGDLTDKIEGGYFVYPTEASRSYYDFYLTDDYLLYMKSDWNLYCLTPENGEELLLEDINDFT